MVEEPLEQRLEEKVEPLYMRRRPLRDMNLINFSEQGYYLPHERPYSTAFLNFFLRVGRYIMVE